MARLAPLVVGLLSVAFLAGCSAAPPTGTLENLNYSPGAPLSGDARIHYQPFTGANPAGQVPGVGGTLQCIQPGPAGPVVEPCRPAYTDVKVNVTLPQGGEGTWKAFLVNATGEVEVGPLVEGTPDGNSAAYTAARNFTDVNLEGRFGRVELRLDGFAYSSADAKEGANVFALAGSTTSVRVEDGAFEGPSLTGTVSGLPPNATYEGNLYLAGADGAVDQDPTATFAIANGPFTYTADRDVSQFVEFHIHVAGSKVNLYKASIVMSPE